MTVFRLLLCLYEVNITTVCFEICTKHKDILSEYTLTPDTPYASAGGDPYGPYIVTEVCIHNTENTNKYELLPEEAH